MEEKQLSKKAAFLRLVKILVDETTRDEPMSLRQIQRRCEEEGFYLSCKSIGEYIGDMREAGIIIARRVELGVERSANLYWYDDGWI